tara:strand:+ start:946 stop:1128 length:183 start_codon:yes stop_codon:yes gene_type:complete
VVSGAFFQAVHVTDDIVEALCFNKINGFSPEIDIFNGYWRTLKLINHVWTVGILFRKDDS